MKSNPSWEILIGDMNLLDSLMSRVSQSEPHPLQELIEDFVGTLSPSEREMFYMRYGEQMPIRKIARRLGYNSHMVIQVKLEKIEQKAREYIECHTSATDGPS